MPDEVTVSCNAFFQPGTLNSFGNAAGVWAGPNLRLVKQSVIHGAAVSVPAVYQKNICPERGMQKKKKRSYFEDKQKIFSIKLIKI